MEARVVLAISVACATACGTSIRNAASGSTSGEGGANAASSGAGGEPAGGGGSSASGGRWTLLHTCTGACALMPSGGVATWTGQRTYYDVSTKSVDIASFEPATSTYTSDHTIAAPSVRSWPQTTLIGGRLWLWGGIADGPQAYVADGGLLDFTTRIWTTLSITGAPEARAFGAAVSTGDRVIVWGGETCDQPGSACLTNSGAVWDLATDTWAATSSVGAPSPRLDPAAVWTGSEMLVWGGANAASLADGAIYDPAKDTWRPMSAIGAPSPRYGPIAIWTGSKMVVWGGSVMLSDHLHDGALYDPANDSWAPMPTETAALTGDVDAPPYVWTGSKLVVFKYAVESGPLAAAVYDPATNQFTEATAQGAPTGSQKAQIVVMGAAWDGQRVLLWSNVWSPPPGPGSLEVWAYELPP